MLSTAIGSPPEGPTGSGCYRWTHDVVTEVGQDNIIYLVRDPRDVMVSLYYHRRHRSRNPYEGSIEDFIVNDPHPRYNLRKLLNHYASMYVIYLCYDPHRFHLLRYEDMDENPERCVRKACEWFHLWTTDELVAKAVEAGRFENMVKVEEHLEPEARKCRVGKAKNYAQELDQATIEYIEYEMGKHLKTEMWGYV
jgi:hypothetical protein